MSMIQVGPTLFKHLESGVLNPAEKKLPEDFNDLCFICFDKPPNSIYKPCGHGGVCETCVDSILKGRNKERAKMCPMCRTKSSQVVIYKKEVIKGKIELVETRTIDIP
jgi:hypothetical protein